MGRWGDARDAYKVRQAENPREIHWALGRLRCEHALGEWKDLSGLAAEVWAAPHLGPDSDARAEVARLGAAGAWNLRQWGAMAEYVGAMGEGDEESTFYRAVLATRAGRWGEARSLIDAARRGADSELTALVRESYHRAYRVVVRVEQLAELEEVILHLERPALLPLPRLLQMWRGRLSLAQRDSTVWQQLITVRELVAPPEVDLPTHLKFASLCRKSGRRALAHNLLARLLGPAAQAEVERAAEEGVPPSLEILSAECSPAVVLAAAKQLWERGAREAALRTVADFVDDPRVASSPALAAKGWLKLGRWQRAALEAAAPLDSAAAAAVIHSTRRATELAPRSYKAWHARAMINLEAVSSSTDGRRHVVPAVTGFFRSIALGRDHALQDILRLLTLWFKYGSQPEVDAAIREGFATMDVGLWLNVVPQIIARLHSPSPPIRHAVHELLRRVARAHPHGLIYPLTVAAKAPEAETRTAAQRLLAQMRLSNDALVSEAELVSTELIHAALSWLEAWHAGLEEASRLYFGAHDAVAMLATLAPLHAQLDGGATTARERWFEGQYGRELREARGHTRAYEEGGGKGCLGAAWDVYYACYRRMAKHLSRLTSLELAHVAPKLLDATDLELSVPGTYQAGQPPTTIRSFSRQLSVIASKQRPRKLAVLGSDGAEHTFLLKGHEDLRQDERVMQLFGLVNSLLSADATTAKHDLSIQRYAIVPLSHNSGLISWVLACDTLHALVKGYREARGTLLNIEHRLIAGVAPDFELLPPLNKLEAFEHALAAVDGADLARVLWLRSRHAEHWLQRRTTYTRSLAVMSMVGYILGLGDRHPSNLMLDRHSGRCCTSTLATASRWRSTATSSPRRCPSASRGCS